MLNICETISYSIAPLCLNTLPYRVGEAESHIMLLRHLGELTPLVSRRIGRTLSPYSVRSKMLEGLETTSTVTPLHTYH